MIDRQCSDCNKLYEGNFQSLYCSSLCKQRAKEKRRKADPERRRLAAERTAKARARHKQKVGSYYKPVSQLSPSQLTEKRRRVNAYRALKAGAVSVPYTDAQLSSKIDYWGGLCWICRSRPWESLDHVKPLSKGGSDMLSNIRPACSKCNSSKGNSWPYCPNRPPVQ